MKKLFILFILFGTTAFPQSVKISGTVTDSIGVPLELAQHTPPQSVKDKIEDLHENNEAMLGDWDIQYLDEAGGAVVNMDYFAVNITSFPTDPTTGQAFTPNDFLDYFRNNINDFVDGTEFEPYCEISTICQQETNLWNSTNPLSAMVKLIFPYIMDGEVILLGTTA